jgi:D-glycero-alpha-D-manno-heptose-7-phosphate kinase
VIIVQTPLRISFFGGGTDFPGYYCSEGGCVLSTSIDKFIYIVIKGRFDDKLRLGYTKTELVDHLDDLEHELIREAMRTTGITQGVEVTTLGDIPSAGSGLGSSSTVTVGALHAMYSYQGDLVTAERLAREACDIEINKLGAPIGIQDQYIAAYGGLRFMEFHTSGDVSVNSVDIDHTTRRRLNENTMLFYTGITRRAGSILGEQKSNMSNRFHVLNEMKQIAYFARDELVGGHLDTIGTLLHESWLLKKSLAGGVSNGQIDEMYAAARGAGALGGKVTGAGGGGFLILYCPHDRQEQVREALSGMQELPFLLENDGSKVIFNYQRSQEGSS